MQVRPNAAESLACAPDMQADTQLFAADDEKAVARLWHAFETSRPVALVTDHGHVRSHRVIRHFLTLVGKRATRIHLETPPRDSFQLLSEIVRGIGFDTKAFGLSELESIFRMFLSFQKTHRRRTVIWAHDAQEYVTEALGKVFEYIDLEADKRYGLFVVLAGPPGVAANSGSNLLAAIAERAGPPIEIAPLAPEQARAFVMRQLESQDFADATLVIDSEAIARMHEISEGVCDTLGGLCDRSLKIAADASEFPITANIVTRAADELGLEARPRCSDDDGDTVSEEFFGSHAAGKLLVKKSGELVCEFLLDSDVVTIGRDKHNALSIPSLYISRHHALVTKGEAGVRIQDLGSTNGTVVNGHRIESQVLGHGDTIVLGDCRMEFVAAARIADQLVASEILSLGRVRQDRTGTLGG